MWFVAVTCLLVVTARAAGSGISISLACPIGMTATPSGCVSRLLIDDEYEELAPRRPDCACVPRYVCSPEHVETQPIGELYCPNAEQVCCSDFPVQLNHVRRDWGCGWSPSGTAAGVSETAAGEAAYGEFPWIVAILKLSASDEWSDDEFVGAGSVIHPRVVLTAAHKLDGLNATQLKCRAGEWSRNESEPRPPQEQRVRRVVVHEGYSRKFMANSIALIFLAMPFDATRGPARAACVARAPPREGAACVVAGWGRRRFRGEFAHRLKKISMPVSRHAMCQAALRQTRLGRSFVLHSSSLCAGGEPGADACTGDGGAPLLCPIQSNTTSVRYAVFGLAAWGVGCGARGVPGVYVDVAQFHEWIHAAIEAHGLAAAAFLYQL